MSEFNRIRMLKLDSELSRPNVGNIGVMKEIEKVEPKYAKHMFLSNELIENFAMHMGGGLDILDQPVCIHCERPAAWNIGGSAYCFSCHKSTPADQAISVMDYLKEYTKMFSEEDLEILNKLGGFNDEIIE